MSGVATSLGQWWTDRRSLRWKLPWLFALTAGAAVGVFGVLAHATVRRVAIDSATNRLESAVTQIRTITELGVVAQLGQLRTSSRDAAILSALNASPAQAPPGAIAALQRLRGVADSNVVVELLDHRGVVRLVVPPDPAALGVTRTLDVPPYAMIGPMYELDQKIFFESTVAVSNGPDTLGTIRVIRQVRNGVNRRLAANLVNGATLLTGNVDGMIWGDSGHYPSPVVGRRAQSQRYRRAGERWLSAAAPVRDTPWLYAVELPERLALAPARALIVPFLLTGLFVAIGAALIGGRISHRITEPLAELTLASESLARGEIGVPPVDSQREDEIGRLARAFSAMALQVRSRSDTLEQEVFRRTGELSAATGQLHLLNEELRESEKLATLGRLSGSVGHELRNPLGVMSNIVFLIDAMPDASHTIKEYAALLREQIRVSDRIISDLLERARSGAPLRSPTNVSHLIDDTVLRADVPATVLVKRQVELPSQPLVLDRDHVSQILWNLIRNAVQAMDGSGTLALTAAHADDRLRIEVRDSGKGIPEADAERVFRPLYTTKSEGIGLGLSVSRAFARASGGDLYAVPGADGACFVLDLPAAVASGGAHGDQGTSESRALPTSGRSRREPASS